MKANTKLSFELHLCNHPTITPFSDYARLRMQSSSRYLSSRQRLIPDPRQIRSGVDSGERKPAWLRQRAPQGERYEYLSGSLRELGLNTVCEEAQCPNIGECWNGGSGTATIMLLGQPLPPICALASIVLGIIFSPNVKNMHRM